MPGSFDLKRLLGQVSKPMLQRFLTAREVDLAVDWDRLPKRRYAAKLFDAWLKLEADDQRRLEPELMDVARIAQERGVSGIIQAASEIGVDLQDELDGYESLPDRVLHVMVEHQRLWRQIQRFVELDLLVTRRFWSTYPGLPARPIDDLDAKLDLLKESVGDFYKQLDGRGRKRKVEHRLRNDRLHYFFVYLDSYIQSELGWRDDDEIAPQRLHPVFDVVFVFDRESGIVEMMAQGGKKVTEPLLRIFCREVLETDPPADNPEQRPYQLGGLLDPEKQFTLEPGDGIVEVYLQALQLRMTGQGGRRITLEGDLDRGPRDVHHMIEELFRGGSVALRDYRVAGAKFKVKFDPNGPISKRSLTFRVSWPHNDDFKGEPEQVREIIKRCLRRWGVDESESAEQLVEAGEAA